MAIRTLTGVCGSKAAPAAQADDPLPTPIALHRKQIAADLI